ncbi:hypothetical protein [Streptomyces sp. Root369]|nr:hypothetical protein [Streptomyces sp. Root369]
MGYIANEEVDIFQPMKFEFLAEILDVQGEYEANDFGNRRRQT